MFSGIISRSVFLAWLKMAIQFSSTFFVGPHIIICLFYNFQVQSEVKKRWHRFRLNNFNHLPKNRKSSNNQTYTTYFSRGRDSNASVGHFHETCDPHINSTVRAKYLHSLSNDSSTALFPMKACNSVSLPGNKTVSELDETEPMIRQTAFPAGENQKHTNGLS